MKREVMLIKQGTIKEMLSLWYKKNTSELFIDKINKNHAEFWTIEIKKKLIGELYLFKSLDDQQFANGCNTAYLCAFRVIDEYRKMGYGTMLMNEVFNRIKELGYKYVTIGVEKEETANVRLYKKMGFSEVIKVCHHDPCDVDENSLPLKCKEFLLLRKSF